MSGTVLEHRLVRDYLGELDAAIRGLPAGQARELREQIRAHLDEALRHDADDREVEAVLGRLGSPAALAAEAGAANAEPIRIPPVGPVRARLARVHSRTWKAAGLTGIVLVAAIAYGAARVDHYLSAAPLQYYNNEADWWYPQDVTNQKIRWAGDTSQNSTTIRFRQRQGYLIAIYNPTGVTQTVLGDASEPGKGVWDAFGGHEQVAVSRSYVDIANGFVGRDAANARFGLPVSIPPFQARLVRVLWTSDLCFNGGIRLDQLYLRVRVGWFTRTEVISQPWWYLFGPNHGRCH